MQRRAFLLSTLALAGGFLTPAQARPPRNLRSRQAVGIGSAELIVAQQRLASRLLLLAGARRSSENIVLSPASLGLVMSYLSLGAEERMQLAIARALGFRGARSEKESKVILAGLRTAVAALASPEAKGPFKAANAIVFDRHAPPLELALLGLKALNVHASIDDLLQPDAIARINKWVEQATAGTIPTIVDTPAADAGFVALNAIHFKDAWQVPFELSQTAAAPFQKADGTQIEVPMMVSESPHRFRQDEQFVAVDLPYVTSGFSLVVLTRKQGPASFRKLMSAAGWLTGNGFSISPGELKLPRLKLASSAQLLPALDRMGLAAARHSPTAFSGLSSVPQRIARISQKTFLTVDESGTVASAATAVVTMRSAAGDFVKMTVNRPFLFALRDETSGLILMTGYVADPAPQAGGVAHGGQRQLTGTP
jgi:serine protease inhibitor